MVSTINGQSVNTDPTQAHDVFARIFSADKSTLTGTSRQGRQIRRLELTTAIFSPATSPIVAFLAQCLLVTMFRVPTLPRKLHVALARTSTASAQESQVLDGLAGAFDRISG
jgi:hypothetical protein